MSDNGQLTQNFPEDCDLDCKPGTNTQKEDREVIQSGVRVDQCRIAMTEPVE